MRELRGRTAVVTGAANGIGQGLAVALAREGMNVGLMDIEGASLDQTRRAVVELGVMAHDVSDRPAILRVADELRAVLGPVHVVCNNAGVGFRCPIHEMPDENFDWLFSVNVTGSSTSSRRSFRR